MLKKLIYTTVILYLFVLYGQNLFEFGSEFRIEFYFIGMALVNALFAFIIYKGFKNLATSFYLFLCIGELFNQIFFKDEFTYIEIIFGCGGFIFILLEKYIKKWKK